MITAGVVLILTSVDGGAASARDVVARADQSVALHAAVRVRGRRGCVLYTDAPKVKSRCRVRALPEDLEYTWLKVEADRAAYDNVPGGKFSFRPIGWLESNWRRGRSRVPADVRPVRRRGVRGAGTMRYRLRIGQGEHVLESAGLAARAGGPSRRADIRKVTVRPDDTYLGYMQELAGLPYIFGSAAQGREPHQAERHIGVDCADLMVYGLRRLGHDVGYRSSRTLGPISRRVVSGVAARRGDVYLAGGRPVRVGAGGVAPGDWLIFEGHVGAFVEDRGRPGVLDTRDLVIHIAWRELAVESLADSGYGASPFEVRRPKALAPRGSN